MAIKRSLTLGLATAAAVAAIAVVALADQEGGATPPGDGVTQVTSVQPDAAAAMAVLNEPRAVGDQLGEAIAGRIDAHPLFGINPDLSRRAIGSVSNSLYVVPGDQYVCAVLTVGEGANFNCPPTSTIGDGRSGPATVVLETGDIGVYGIVPDGVGSVTVATGAAGSGAVDVLANTYFTVLDAGTAPGQVGYTGPSGHVEFPIYDPSLPEVEPAG
jgi:hypothetical protein